ncbi:DUF6544 family protein [Embleya scabrispora]|uniref:DUF6544 family protein n=1 Tax=Embleya scabrispora TaxID=159449 RepID=UPI00037D5D21|nr:DUF6544 family protein [Embleya scabrispora]MYS79174.1 hypothetical protein [Streptomyces sp. SID5474]
MRTPHPSPEEPASEPPATSRDPERGEPTGGPPGPIRRWLAHAVPPGAPTPTSVELRAHGRIRVRRWWCPFESRQTLTPPTAFRWDADVRGPAGIRIRGFDRLDADGAAMRWRLFGVLPFIGASGADVTRSAAGRLAGEFVLVPTFALHRDVRWQSVDDTRAIARFAVAGHPQEVTVTVTPSGALASVSLPRWGNPDGRRHREHRFFATFDGEISHGGFLLPTGIHAGWEDTGAFIHYDIDAADFR